MFGPVDSKILCHVSFEAVTEFKPRVPKVRLPDEDATVPRICFSESLASALCLIPGGGQALRGMLALKNRLTPVLHLYFCKTKENTDVRFVCPRAVKGKYNVYDALANREWWALDTPRLDHVIAIVHDAEFSDGTNFIGEKGVAIHSVNSEFVMELPSDAPENVFCAPIVSEIGLRRVLAEYDQMRAAGRKAV